MSATQFKKVLQQPYDREIFAKEILARIFNNRFQYQRARQATEPLTETDKKTIQSVSLYGNIKLDDGNEVTCYEILLTPSVRIERSRVAIQNYVRRLLRVDAAALVNFVTPHNKNSWRLTFIAKDSELTEDGVKETATNVKRYTYLLGSSESCKTAAERLEALQNAVLQDKQAFLSAFSVEKLSKTFFDEYKIHYNRFVDYLQKLDAHGTFFKGDDKAMRDFSKKLLGRLVFLYFVQKKGWLGASNTDYKDGNLNFIRTLFLQSGGGANFYYKWLSVLFFDTLNAKRLDDTFKMPDGSSVKIPFLNGGLFDKDKNDENVLTFNPNLFYNDINPDDPKTRGFLDFLEAFNFTVFEDSPDEHTVAVDPEMLGHIFENLLEDNKDKGAFYTPKEIVHYMCQESLIEYLTTHLSKEYTVYLPFGKAQVELFGNDTKQGQLAMIEEIGDKALNRNDVVQIVKHKNIAELTQKQLNRISQLLDTVKICDPAIGSGAFPMGLLHEIFAIKEIIAFETKTAWLPAKVKQNIIQNSIYGVDIERGAVDIARLRFWLSLVVDEDKPQPLPNLDYKIVVGNSLVSKFEDEVIEIDWEKNKSRVGMADTVDKNIQDLLRKLVETQKQYFNANNQDKKNIQIKIRGLKIDLLINQLSLNREKYFQRTPVLGGFAPTAKDTKHNLERDCVLTDFDKKLEKLQFLKNHSDKPLKHFDWKLDFPEILNPLFGGDTEGFDIVIGNPPYVQLQSMKGSEIYENGNQTYSKSGDIYSIFYEKAFQISKTNAVVTYITSNKWMRAEYGKTLRNFFTKYTNPILIIDFGSVQVFPSANVDTNILIFKKESFQGNVNACRFLSDYEKDLNSISKYFDKNKINYTPKNEDAWIISNILKRTILDKVIEFGTPLSEWNIQINFGIKTALNEVLMIKEDKKDYLISKDPKNANILKPILRGRDIKRWSFEFSNCWLVDTYNGFIESIIEPNKNIIQHEDKRFSYKAEGSDEWRIAKRIEHCRGKQYRIDRIDVSSDYPTVYDYLKDYELQMKKREDKGEHWTNLRNCAYYEDFKKPKILWADIMRISKSNSSDFPRFGYDEKGLFPEATIFIMTGDNIKYLLASLNSKLFAMIFKEFYAGTMFDDAGVRYKKGFLMNLPIKQLTKEPYIVFDYLVSYLIWLKENQSTPSVSPHISAYFEQVIDGMVCELYFEEDMKGKKTDIIGIVTDDLKAVADFTTLRETEKQAAIAKLYAKWTSPTSAVQKRLLEMTEKSPETIGVILGQK